MFDSKNPQRTPISSLGEFGLIEHLTKNTTLKHASTALGIGDDAALIDQGEYYTAISTDMLVEGIHFDLSYMPLKHLGYKSVMVNLSSFPMMRLEQSQVWIGNYHVFSKKATFHTFDYFPSRLLVRSNGCSN